VAFFQTNNQNQKGKMEPKSEGKHKQKAVYYMCYMAKWQIEKKTREVGGIRASFLFFAIVRPGTD